jgi:hypothetical protein
MFGGMNTKDTIVHEDAHEQKEQVRSGRILSSGIIGAAFASCLTLASVNPAGHLATYAMYLLVASMPVLAMHLMVTSPGHERRYHLSFLMKMMPILGLLCAIIGFGLIFEMAASGAGVLFAVLSIFVMVVCSQSTDRAR